MLKKLDLPWLYYGLALSQVLHSTEEVLTRLWAWLPRVTATWHAQVSWIPVLPGWGETNFAVANLVIVTGLLALTPFVFQRRPWALKLAFWIAAIEIANGAGHLAAALFVRGYFPGVLAGIGLLVFGIWFVLSWRMERV
jgi:hypothetical protein